MERRRFHKKDNVAEMILREVLIEMRSEGRIAGFIQSRKNDRLDVEGIDFLMFLRNNLALAIQVKTHSRNRRRCLEKHFRRYSLVKFVLFIKIGFYNRRPESASRSIKKEIEGFVDQCLSRQ